MQAVAPRRRRALGACSVQGHCSSGTGEVSGRGRPVWKPAMISRSVMVPVASSLSSNGDSHPLSRHGLLRADSAAARQQYYSFMQGLASRSAGVPGGGRRARKGVMVQEWPGPDGCEAVDEGLHLVPRAVLGQPVRPRPELLGGGIHMRGLLPTLLLSEASFGVQGAGPLGLSVRTPPRERPSAGAALRGRRPQTKHLLRSLSLWSGSVFVVVYNYNYTSRAPQL